MTEPNVKLSYSGASTSLLHERVVHGHVRWLSRCLSELGLNPATVLHYGGAWQIADTLITDAIGASSLARHVAGDRHFDAPGSFDLAIVDDAVHALSPRRYQEAAVGLYRSLRPGGLLAFCVANPAHPATRESAGVLTPGRARRLGVGAGFDVLRTDYLFVSLTTAEWLRPIETLVSSLPFGTRYQVLCQKP